MPVIRQVLPALEIEIIAREGGALPTEHGGGKNAADSTEQFRPRDSARPERGYVSGVFALESVGAQPGIHEPAEIKAGMDVGLGWREGGRPFAPVVTRRVVEYPDFLRHVTNKLLWRPANPRFGLVTYLFLIYQTDVLLALLRGF